MPATATDRIDGLTTSVAVKAPCKVASTANITLSGPQTISGVAVVAGDRVLVTAQTNAVDNGIWVVQAGTWKRAKDFDGQRDVVQGTMVLVGPQDSARRFYGVITPNPIVIGTTEIEFDEFDPTEEQLRLDLADPTNPANGAGLVGFNATLNYVAGTIGHATRQRSVSPVDHPWLARFDGTTDDSPAIQACINWIISVGGGTIILPRGIANLGAGLAWAGSNVNIIGQGEGATTLRCSFAAGDILTVGDGTANPNNCGISCLSITSSVAKTSGAAIRFRNGHNLRASRIRLDNNMYWGFQFDGGAQQFLYYLDNFEINSGSIGVIVGNDGTLVQDLWVATGVIANCTNDAILLKHCSGWYFRELDLLACGKGLSTFPDAEKRVVAGWMYMVVADTCNSHGYSIITNGGLVAEITMTAPWGASCGVTDNGHGIFVNPGAGTITGISMTVPRCINNRGAGIRINGGRDITITNPQCFANSQQGSALHDGISVAAGVEKFSIIGGKSGAGGLFGTNNQRYGINVESGASNNYAIIGVDVLGNVTGGINDGGTGGEKHIYGNVGYRTSQQGSALISSGTSSVTVNHGLSVTPAQTDFITIPTVNISAVGITNWWVDNVTSTSFRINTNANVTANTFFAWTVRTRGA